MHQPSGQVGRVIHVHTSAARTNHIDGGILHALKGTTGPITMTGAAGTPGQNLTIV